MRIGAVATAVGTSAPKARMEMSDATVKLMDITSDMSSALQAGADDGQATQRNGKRAGRMNDLIKREDAIKAISISCGTCLARGTEDCDKCSVPKLCELISAIPSADRPSGEWEYVYKGKWMFRRCSYCKWTQTYDDSKYMGYRYNFCPHCGARMKGADDE